MANNIRIEGVEELLERFEGLADTQELRMSVGKACALVERSAKQKAPKPKGEGENLRASITSKIEEQNGDIVGIVFTPLYYAPYVEFGTGLFAENGNGRQEVPWVYVEGSGESSGGKKTIHTEESARQAVAFLASGQKPQPYMRPALNENREQIVRILQEGLHHD